MSSLPINLSDNDLFIRLQRDDHEAYRELYVRYTGVLYAHAYLKLQDREEARDAVQEVFTTLWLRRATIELEQNISGYLYTALRNKVLNLIARRKLQSDYTASLQKFIDRDKVETDHLVRLNQLKAIVESAVQHMPDKMREIFDLSRNQHLSHREIAQKLGISEKTVKNQINNALKILRAKLGTFHFLLFLPS